MIAVARPWLLLLLLALPLWWWWRRRQARTGPGTAARVGDATAYVPLAKPRWWLALPPVFRGLAVASLIVAASGPAFGASTLELKAEGISIVIALDISSSMLAEDFAPANRLEVAKRQAISFIRGRTSDRIGLVAFAGEALTQVPITYDYAVIEQAVMDLRIGVLEDGTAIGSGLVTAVNRLRRTPDKSKVVLLLTDGENNKGLVDPRTAASTAQAYGIKVYTIGVGTQGEAPIPTGRGAGGFRYEVMPVNIDEPLLRDIAKQTGGRYFRATDSESLARIFRQIDELEKTPVELTRQRQHDETTRPFLLASLVFLGAELAAAGTIAMRVPG